MSLALHRLGRFIGRHRLIVIGVWVVLLLGVGGSGFVVGAAFEDDNSIPGTESQEGQDVLAARFGSAASGASAQLLFRAVEGDVADDGAWAVVESRLDDVAAVDGVAGVTAADELTISDDGGAALATVQFEDRKPSEHVLEDARRAAVSEDEGVVSTIGGSSYNAPDEQSHLGEVIGMGVALLVLLLTFGSLLAAGMPLIAALVSVGATLGGLFAASHLASISPSTSAFASMLGLAVAIDYSLFILSRHRQELGRGQTPEEAMARALGTAGTAVVFAGLTVIVALAGLFVVGIPTLTVMAVGGAVSVAMGVLVALTLLPALALMAGPRLRPRSRRRATQPARHGSWALRWVRTVTRMPVVTIILVVATLAVVAIPTASMQLGLRDASTQPVGSASRDHFDNVAASLGPGWNAPLLVTVDVLASENPVATMEDLQAAVEGLDGVAAVPIATPNAAGDTGLLRIIPDGGQNDPVTAELVADLRDRASEWEEEFGVSDIRVTGTTAINIDISARMQAALLPFTLTVVGLSLVLLLLVFRSIWVPVKAALGFLLSVGAAFGAIVAVFQWGWFPGILDGDSPGPLVSFLPILVIGVLFGLAMDYEMFLVSRMREEFTQTGDARAAVEHGFLHSAPVVTAAAVIMISVFVAFVPGGNETIKPIAFGLAVGVFVDAFLIRMTLVPAVMVAWGRHAWWLPAALSRLLPVVDIEGDAVMRQAAVDESPAAKLALSLRDVQAGPGEPARTRDVRFGELAVIAVTDARAGLALAYALGGRAPLLAGTAAVAGAPLPEAAAHVRRVAAVLTADSVPPAGTARDYVEQRLEVTGGRRRDRRDRERLIADLVGDLDTPLTALPPSARQFLAAAVAHACGARILLLPGSLAQRDAQRLVDAGATVVLFPPTTGDSSPSSLQIGAFA